MAEQIVYDVEPGRFEQDVIQASFSRPIVVDFWAEWCAPCRALGPVLERVVQSFGGRARLARVNIERDRDVAVQFGIQSIPAVKVFRHGEVVGQFVGALAEPDVQLILSKVVPSEADEVIAEGDGLAQEGRIDDAEARYRKALDMQPGHSGALLRIATVALETGRSEEACELLGQIEEDAPEHGAAQGLLASVEFAQVCQQNGGAETCRRALDENPHSLDARYNYACCLTAEREHEAALKQFLEILSRDKGYRDGAAKEAMLRIFALVGQHGELASTYRRKLAGVLY